MTTCNPLQVVTRLHTVRHLLKIKKQMELQFNDLPKAVTQLTNDVNEIKRLLLERCDEQHPPADELLTIQQAAEFLKLSVPTIYGLVSRSEVPVCKRGKRLYFSKQELTDYIRSGRKKTISEIQAEADLYLVKKKGSTK